jgi:hypothetical protein
MLTTAPGPTFMKNDGQSGARSGDHTHVTYSCLELLLKHGLLKPIRRRSVWVQREPHAVPCHVDDLTVDQPSSSQRSFMCWKSSVDKSGTLNSIGTYR